MSLYVNGVSVGTGTDSTNYTATTGTWYINSNDSGPTPGGAGYISNLRIIKGTAVYTAAFTPPASPLTAITNTSLLTCQSNRFIDNSTNAFAITRNGDVSVQRFSPFNPTAPYAAGTDGGSGYFDGSGDYLSVVDNAAFTLGSGDWTIEAWVFTGTSATQKVVAGQIDSGGNVSSLSFQLDMSSTDYPRIIIASGTTTYIATSSSTLPKNQWVHLAGVRDGNTMRIYVNGVQTGTQSVTGVTVNDSSSNVGIGRHGEYAGLDWNGYISNFRLVKGTCVYPSGTTFTPPTAPLTAITNTSLLTNFTNGGIIDNAMMNDLETVGNAQISTAQSKFGGASMYFDGTGDFLYGAPSESYQLGTGDFTIEFWINASASGSYNQVVGTYNVNHDAGAWRVGNRFNSANQVYFARGTGSGVNEFTANVNVNDGIWHHVAVVRSSGTVTIYVDGTASASSTITGTCSSSNQLRVGYNPRDNSYLTGYIDDLRITKGYARYTSSFTAPTAPFPLQ